MSPQKSTWNAHRKSFENGRIVVTYREAINGNTDHERALSVSVLPENRGMGERKRKRKQGANKEWIGQN